MRSRGIRHLNALFIKAVVLCSWITKQRINVPASGRTHRSRVCSWPSGLGASPAGVFFGGVDDDEWSGDERDVSGFLKDLGMTLNCMSLLFKRRIVVACCLCGKNKSSGWECCKRPGRTHPLVLTPQSKSACRYPSEDTTASTRPASTSSNTFSLRQCCTSRKNNEGAG